MDIPLEIAFHNVDPSTEIENLVHEHVDRLQKRYPHLIGCRVSLEMLHRAHRNGNVPEVHIAMRVPGREIVISREPHKPQERRAAPSVHTSLKDAFRAAEKRLKDFKDLQYGEVRMKDTRVQGYISHVVAEKNY